MIETRRGCADRSRKELRPPGKSPVLHALQALIAADEPATTKLFFSEHYAERIFEDAVKRDEGAARGGALASGILIMREPYAPTGNIYTTFNRAANSPSGAATPRFTPSWSDFWAPILPIFACMRAG